MSTHGQSIRAFQVLEKIGQVNEEVSQEGKGKVEQVGQAEQAEEPVRSSIPRS
jgi:NAD+--asparagine ADP-ribosyltransferase